MISKKLDFSSITLHHDITNNLSINTIINDQDQQKIEMIQELLVDKNDKEVQVSIGDIFVPFVSLIDSQKKLVTITGIPTFTILKNLIELFSINFPDTRTHLLSIKERIILIFFKLKQDLSFAILSIFFKKLFAETCRAIYVTNIPLLASILQHTIYWPSKNEILMNIPYCFEKFTNTRIVLDCTEIPIQKLKCLTCRIKTYSNYKSTFTLKFLIGISPGGLITFISKPYGGRASDKLIFEQSGLINMMEHSDAIMVDKGFMIDDLCKQKQIAIIRPPFLKNKKQFLMEEALLNRDIASARVHIERMNQRLKTFKILQNKFTWAHAHLAHNIIIIIGGICNLSTPIFSNDKFNNSSAD